MEFSNLGLPNGCGIADPEKKKKRGSSMRMPFSSIYKINGTASSIAGIYKISGTAMSLRVASLRMPFS
eukprot:10729241-Heterocapsa_arctica.AAC.1